MEAQSNEKITHYAFFQVFASRFVKQKSKLSMQYKFSDHIVSFGSDSEWLPDISTVALRRLRQLSPVSFIMSSLLTFYQLSW